jgi:dUTP pyrophosphatase
MSVTYNKGTKFTELIIYPTFKNRKEFLFFLHGIIDEYGNINNYDINKNYIVLQLLFSNPEINNIKNLLSNVKLYFNINVYFKQTNKIISILFIKQDVLHILNDIYNNNIDYIYNKSIFTKFEKWTIKNNSYYNGFDLNIDYLNQISSNNELKQQFLRGWFDKNGFIKSPFNYNNPEITIECVNKENLIILLNYIDVCGTITKNSTILLYGCNAMDFLSNIYDNSNEHTRNKENYDLYLEWNKYQFPKNRLIKCSFYKEDPQAIIPSKSRHSDVGYDLTIIKKVKNITNDIIMYDTGIIVQPEYGYYTKIVPRSSIVKTGYMLANSIGIIDGNFLGTLKIVLIKIDKTLPDITLPCKIAQLIIDKSIHYQMIEIDSNELNKTSRGGGEFGSTGALTSV